MNENLAYKINSSFRLLGLKPGADARQIRSAFRHLARTHHPDIAGAFNSKKFEQISNAYLLLKNLTPEELALCEVKSEPEHPENVKESFFARWKRKRAEKEAKREADLHAQREAEKMAKEAHERVISDRIDLILDKYTRKINSIYERKQKDKLNQEISNIIVRLEASRYEVRLMAMQNLSKYINAPRIFESLLNMLNKYPITGEMLNIISTLPLSREYMQKIIKIVSDNVKNLKEQEILPFIRKIIFIIADNKDIVSKFMEHSSLKITELLIARWTFAALPNENVLARVFSDIQNEKLIILTLNVLKRHDMSTLPSWLTQRIKELLTHNNVSIRLLAGASSQNNATFK